MSPPAVISADAAAGYRRLRDGAPAWVAERVSLVWVEGPDAVSFLHGLLSNDVAGLAPGASTEALLLDSKGHVQAAMGVHRDAEDALTLVLDPLVADRVVASLERHHFSEDLEILGPEDAAALTLSGISPPPGPSVPGPLPGTVRVVVDDAAVAGAALAGEPAPEESLEMARVAAGMVRVGVEHRAFDPGAGGRPGGPCRVVREGLLPGPGDRGAPPVPRPGQPDPAGARP